MCEPAQRKTIYWSVKIDYDDIAYVKVDKSLHYYVGFFGCTFPTASRDLTSQKQFVQSHKFLNLCTVNSLIEARASI